MYNENEQINLADIKAGMTIEGCYFLKNSVVKSTKNSTFFLDTTIVDNSMPSGISAKLWDIAADYAAPEAGNLVYITFTAETYDGNIQGRIKRIMIVDGSNVRKERLDKIIEKVLPTAPVDINDTIFKFENYINELSDEYKEVINDVIDTVGREKFYTIAAGRKMHGACRYGNIVHTLHVIENCIGISKQYKNIDMNLLIASAAIHDCGKAYDEFVVSEYGLVSDYSTSANLCGGHIISGSTLVYEIAKKHQLSEEKCMLLRHMILSHHSEFGPVMPGIPEAYILSMSDRIDATIEQIQEAILTVEPGKTTDSLQRLGNARIYNRAIE